MGSIIVPNRSYRGRSVLAGFLEIGYVMYCGHTGIIDWERDASSLCKEYNVGIAEKFPFVFAGVPLLLEFL